MRGRNAFDQDELIRNWIVHHIRMQRGAKEEIMKRARNNAIRKEYDFSQGVRGKYAKRFAAGSNVVLLDPDIAKRFPDSHAVNQALRGLVELADRSAKQ